MTVFNILSLIGGLSLFLFAMSYMGSSLEKLGGGKFESTLEKMTNSRIKGVLLGAGVTAVVQSSSAVTVMAVGFVNSSIMTLHQVTGIIMGANIGTTITSWLLSLTGIQSSNMFVSLLKPSSFTPLLALIGMVLYVFCKSERKKDVGSILLGFAVLMFGMEAMSSALEPLKDVPEFTNLLVKFSNPVLGVLAGAVLTAVIQSSSASVGILQALAVTGSISVSSAFPVILGQNIGTCVTAMISSIGANKNAKRTAVVHLTFNTIGVIAAMLLFYGVNALIGLPFIKNTVNAADIAVIHTVFNVFSTVLLFPFGRQLEKIACIIIPSNDSVAEETLPEERFLMSPSFAIDKVKQRCNKMGVLARENTELCLDFVRAYSHIKEKNITENEKQLDSYEDELETYLVKLSSHNLSFNDSIKISKLAHAIGNFERIGDYGCNLMKIKKRMHQGKIHFTDDANSEIETMSRAVSEIVEIAATAFTDDNIELAMSVEPLEQVIDNLKRELRERHAKRIQQGICSVENGMLFFDIINSFERIADHCSNLAACIIELSQGSFQTHRYLSEVKSKNNKDFMTSFEYYLKKYKIG